METIHKRVGSWFDAFIDSPKYLQLTEIQRSNAQGIVRFFTEYSFNYIGVVPEQWNRDSLTECCVEILPRKMTAEPAFFQSIAPTLSAFFSFLAEQRLLGNAGELAKAVADLDEEIIAASQDKRNWGPAKSLLMAAEEAGVDACNPQALDAFMAAYNMRLISQMEARQHDPVRPPTVFAASGMPAHRSEPKIGRNDPCPCGSGKKYKKCCGA